MSQTKHKNKPTHKFILNAARRKTIRKMKGGWPWSKKTADPVPAPAPAAAPIAPSRLTNQNAIVTASAIVKTSTAVAVTTTLGTMIAESLAEPSTILAITGFASTSAVVATGGVILVALAVGMAAFMILRERKKAYKGLILVMDELYLVIQKLNGIVDVSMHIANAYGFPMDMRDVQIALDAILAKFDELLDPTTDYPQIKNSLQNLGKLRKEFNGLNSTVTAELADHTDGDDSNDPPTISLWTRAKNASSSVVKSFKKNIMFSAPKFVQELNEAVAYLALYVGIFSASFSVTYTTVVLQLLVNGKNDELKSLQQKVYSDPKFIAMIEGAVVFPLLQSEKTYQTCLLKSSNADSCGSTFSKAAANVLKDMKRIVSPDNVVGSELYANMTNLKQVVNNTNDITSVENAIAFTAAVEKAFADDKAAQSATQTPVATQGATQTPVATQGATQTPDTTQGASEQITTDNNVQQPQ